ncbi:hypothetical protein DIE21_36450 [Burkholderia sp. Bp9140]|nr:hypothetical protein DIE21_36450 [Burkholderia sp. Bp9140]
MLVGLHDGPMQCALHRCTLTATATATATATRKRCGSKARRRRSSRISAARHIKAGRTVGVALGGVTVAVGRD